MDAEQFDDLSRSLGSASSRRGLVAGLSSGLLALLASATIRQDTGAKNKKKRGKKNRKGQQNRKKERCKRFGDSCTPGGERTCCNTLVCDVPQGGTSSSCCKVEGVPCGDHSECCRNHFCYKPSPDLDSGTCTTAM